MRDTPQPIVDERAYRGVAEGVGLIDRSARVRLSISGPDRAKFLHNLTTNEIKKLAVSQGREAFVTSLQGKTIGFVLVHATEDESLLVRTDANGADLVLPHFRKYGIFDEVTIDDLSGSTVELHVVGPHAEKLVNAVVDIVPGPEEYRHVAARLGAVPVRVIREAPTGYPGLTIIGGREAAGELLSSLRERGKSLELIELDEPTFDLLRIEAGTPIFGRDITEKNLPQEIGRDDRAISFVKGCYLGQETVARIDALGHVNQILRGIRLEPTPSGRLEPGGTLKRGGKDVATFSSVAFSPGGGTWIGLGYVRTSALDDGGSLPAFDAQGNEIGTALICDLPMRRPQEE